MHCHDGVCQPICLEHVGSCAKVMWTNIYDKPGWDTDLELEYDVMPRDEFGVPAHIPPEISTTIRHTSF